jgi:hypothetical protein
MEAVVILGIAANVAQFVGYAGRLIARANQSYQSSNNLNIRSAELNAAATNLADLNKRIPESAARLDGGHESGSATYDGILEANLHCQKIAEEMMAALQKLRSRGHPHALVSIRKAFRTVWSEEKLEEISKRLSDVRDQLMLHVLVHWRYVRCA